MQLGLGTLTSKKQVTVPSKIFDKAGFKIGQKVTFVAENGRVTIAPAELLVEELAGSLRMPKKWQGKTMDQIISQAKQDYFINKQT